MNYDILFGQKMDIALCDQHTTSFLKLLKYRKEKFKKFKSKHDIYSSSPTQIHFSLDF